MKLDVTLLRSGIEDETEHKIVDTSILNGKPLEVVPMVCQSSDSS